MEEVFTHLRPYLSLLVPIVMANIVHTVFMQYSTLVLGRNHDSHQQLAYILVFNLTQTLTFLHSILGSASTQMMASSLGRALTHEL